MANDPNLVAVLIPKNERAVTTFAHQRNQKFYVPSTFVPDDSSSDDDSERGRREKTPQNSPKGSDEQRGSRLELTFNSPPRDPRKGWAFGSNPRICDVWIGNRGDGFSECTFTIRFVIEGGYLAMITTSTNKIWITYDEDPYPRHHFTWILFSEKKVIGVNIADILQFDIIIPNHTRNLAAYEAMKTQFMSQKLMTYMSLMTINSQRASEPETRIISGAETPPQTGCVYTPFALLGRGGMGVVEKVRCASTGHVFACKTLHQNSQDKRKFLEQTKREAKILETVGLHENIVMFIDFTMEHEKPRIIMEYVQGGNLADLQFREPLRKGRIALVLWNCLLGASHLHRRGISHRDIKPENILISRASPLRVKLADFGLAKQGSMLTTVCGTPYWMAPELNELEWYDFGADIWSLGVVILWLLDRTPEYDLYRNDHYEWCTALQGAVVNNYYKTWPKSVDRELMFLLNSMLRTDPDNRLDVDELLDCDKSELMLYLEDRTEELRRVYGDLGESYLSVRRVRARFWDVYDDERCCSNL